VVRYYEKRTSVQTNFYVGDVCNMMSVPAEGAERLAEIFREMLALSETRRSNRSQSAVANDSIELFDMQDSNRSAEVRAAQRNHSRDESQDR
jgi:hypothetical protein